MSEKINYSGPEFLHKQKLSPEEWGDINQSAKRSKRRKSKKLRSIIATRHGEEWKDMAKYPDSSVQIQNYLNRFQDLIHEKNPQKKWDGLDVLKRYLHMVATIRIRPEDVSEKRHRNEIQTIINDQKKSLDDWIDYLSSDDIKYPDWLKYYVFKNIIQMGRYNKFKKKFTSREGKGTVSPFPELNRDALLMVLDDIEKQVQKEPIEFTIHVDDKEKQQYLKLLKKKKFSELYAFAIERFNPISEELLKNIEGKWIIYSRGSSPSKITESLSEFGTGWCIRSEGKAEDYLKNNNLYIFYSNNKNGQAKIPRVVIVEDDNGNIKEVRGVKEEENLDPYIGNVVADKLKEFGKASEIWKKKSDDMKKITEIQEKTKNNRLLTKEDLGFIYEIDNNIEGFGYGRDPRINEIKKLRKPENDINIVFDCTEKQIAHNANEINVDTKVYIGEWNLNVFNKIWHFSNVKYLYEQFPDKKIFMKELQTDPTIDSAQMIEKKLKEKNIFIIDWARDILKDANFNAEEKTYNLVKFRLEQLGFSGETLIKEIIGSVDDKDKDGNLSPYTSGIVTKLGFEFCPIEVGCQLRLQYDGEEEMTVAMKPVYDRYNYLHMLALNVNKMNNQLMLGDRFAGSKSKCNSNDSFVFYFYK